MNRCNVPNLTTVFILCVASVLHIAAGAPVPTKIASIHVSGQQRYSEAQIIAASGLQRGQELDVNSLQSAVQLLGASGAFDDVEYRYRPESAGMAVELVVKENTKLHRVVFDNFAWYTDGQIEEYLRKQVPLFGDVLPESGGLLDDVSTALQQLLANDKIEAQVVRIQFGSLGDPNWVHVYSASGPELKIQSVQFEGAQGVDAATLQNSAQPLVGRDFSRVQCRPFGDFTFVPLYRERGYLRVAIADPTARVLNHPAGTNHYDVEATFQITEGLVYTWSSAQWSGNQATTPAELNALVGVSPGEIANGIKIDAGWEAVRAAYGNQGYIEATVSPEPVYDDANRSVTFRTAISEGPQYHMGTFTVTGATPALAQKITSAWKLKPSDVYDSSYARDFMKKDLLALLAGAQPHPSSIHAEKQPNRDTHTVDVSITLK